MDDIKTDEKRVAIADDSILFRAGCKYIVNRLDGFSVCGEGTVGVYLAQDLARWNPRVLVVDISAKGGSGFDLLKEVTHRGLDVHMLVVSRRTEPHYVERALHAGALGYVEKRASRRTFATAIQHLAAGKCYVSDPIRSRMFLHMTGHNQPRDNVGGLSDRELEVFERLGRGKTVGEIAREMTISPRTVTTHCRNMREVLGQPHQAQLRRYAVMWMHSRGYA